MKSILFALWMTGSVLPVGSARLGSSADASRGQDAAASSASALAISSNMTPKPNSPAEVRLPSRRFSVKWSRPTRIMRPSAITSRSPKQRWPPPRSLPTRVSALTGMRHHAPRQRTYATAFGGPHSDHRAGRQAEGPPAGGRPEFAGGLGYVGELPAQFAADAATAFVEGLAAQRALEQKRRAARSLEDMVAANEQQLRVGDVGEMDVTQSRGRSQFQSEVLAARKTNTESSPYHVGGGSPLTGQKARTAQCVPLRPTRTPPVPSFHVEQLLTSGLVKRADLLALRRTRRDAAEAGVQPTYPGRIPDVDGVGGGNHPQHRLPATSSPLPQRQSAGTIAQAIPLPLFKSHLAEVATAPIAYPQGGNPLQTTERGG